MSKRMIFWEIKKVIMFGMFMIMVGSGLAGAHRAVAQDAQSNWSEPVNLSQSGSTVDPSIVIASEGVVHVIWVDEYEGYIHTKKEGNLWSTPIPVEFPFYREFGFPPDSNVGKTLPEFIPDRTGFIHAFWFDEDEELSYSRVGDDEFELGAAWLGTRSLSESAINFDVDADSNGGLHLVYVRAEDTPETPAGVYYQSSLDGGFSWSNPILIYDNRYFRSLSGDRAHVDISTTNIDGSSVVYITWDDPPFKRNFIAKSMDGGENWETPVIIHAPESDVSVDIPFQTVISANGLQTILVWHTRDENLLTCNSYYQFSQDGGATWSNPQQFLNDYFFCPTRSIIFSGNNGNAILWLEFEDTVLLVAWDGTQWSEPQEQVELDSFPDTNSFSTVLFRCRQPALSGTGQMYVVGCDEGFGSDIWLSSRVIGDTSVWYPPPPKWGAPVIVSNEEFQPVAPLMTISNNGIAHIVWSQNTPTDATQVEAQESIYYGLVDSGGWFPSGDIATSPQGKASSAFYCVGFQRTIVSCLE